MDPQKPKTSAKDFFLNLGAIVALYTTIIALLNLLFTVINIAYPQITNYYYSSSSSISFPVATLIIFFPIYILLMRLLEKSYAVELEKRHFGVRKWLTYITLFIAGLTLAGDLVTVLYYFIDGQELTTGFILKVLAVLVVILAVFLYYISDIREKLTTKSRNAWSALSFVFILACITWGFIVLGSPWTQQQYKYDQTRISDLQLINNEITSFYQLKGYLPSSIDETLSPEPYTQKITDPQTSQPYEYVLIGQSAKTFQICATFNKASSNQYPALADQYGDGVSWSHPAGHYCFTQTVIKQPAVYPLTSPAPAIKN